MGFFQRSTWKRKFHRFLSCFYDPRSGKVLGKPPKSLLGLILFLGIFYLFIAGLFYAEKKIVDVWMSNIQTSADAPAVHEILSNRIGLKFLMNILKTPPKTSTFDEYKSEYEKQLKEVEEFYKNNAVIKNKNCELSNNEQPSCFIPMDDTIFSDCMAKSKTLSNTTIVYWLTISKIVNFVPGGIDLTNNIGFQCNVTKTGSDPVKLTVYPTEGINRSQLPYRNSQKLNGVNQTMPIVCTIVDIEKYDELSCLLKSNDIKVVAEGGPSTYTGYIRTILPKFTPPTK